MSQVRLTPQQTNIIVRDDKWACQSYLYISCKNLEKNKVGPGKHN